MRFHVNENCRSHKKLLLTLVGKIPVLDYLSFNAKYNATYTWDRGAQISEEIDLGNSVNNQGQLSFDGRFNFEQLYNKSKYLQKMRLEIHPMSAR